jgi:hypothetical protein
MDKVSRIFGIFFLVDFFFSDNSKCFHRNGFEMYILIIIYTVSKNWTKTLKSVIMNDTGPHLGKSKQNQEISEFKIPVGTNVSHVQTV